LKSFEKLNFKLKKKTIWCKAQPCHYSTADNSRVTNNRVSEMGCYLTVTTL